MNPKGATDSNGSGDADDLDETEWGVAARQATFWPARLAILAALALYITLPSKLTYGPIWLIPAIEVALFLALFVTRQMERFRWERWLAIGLIAAMTLANIGSLLLLIHALVSTGVFNGHQITARDLVFWSAQIWLTNVIVFGVWYWELDRGGPVARCLTGHREPDFLFPQMANPHAAPPGWTPSFLDYLYTSFTNASAFSPTDTLPLSEWAKVLFAIQASASLLTVILVTARAVNILR